MAFEFPGRAAFVAAAGLALVATGAAAGDFSGTDTPLFVGWPGLEGIGFPDAAEAKVYAIIDESGGWARPVYVILLDNGRALSPVGTMSCEAAFQVLNDQHNGWHDILCENAGWSSIWAMGPDGEYHPR